MFLMTVVKIVHILHYMCLEYSIQPSQHGWSARFCGFQFPLHRSTWRPDCHQRTEGSHLCLQCFLEELSPQQHIVSASSVSLSLFTQQGVKTCTLLVHRERFALMGRQTTKRRRTTKLPLAKLTSLI